MQRIFGPIYRWIFRRLTGIDLSRDAPPGRLLSRRVITYLMAQPNPVALYRTFPARSGFSHQTLEYDGPLPYRARRSLALRIRSGLMLLTANTMAPLRLVSIALLFGAALNLFYSGYVMLVATFKSQVAAGWVTLSLQQSGMFFLLSSVLFVINEYLVQLIYRSSGPGYFIASEHAGELLTRTKRLNVEGARLPSDAACPTQ